MTASEGPTFASDTWADQLRAFPWIADEGGEIAYNQAFHDARHGIPNVSSLTGAATAIGSQSFASAASERKS